VSKRPLKLFQKTLRLFPDPAGQTIDGIVTMGIPLATSTLFEAYSFGIFPWPHPDLPMLWYCPDERGVLDFKDFHVPKSLKKKMQKKNFEITYNQRFLEVITACAETRRPGQAGTWITRPVIEAYLEFHRSGYAHSIEVLLGGELVGGLYGVYVGGVFAGESMFHRVSDASKIALVAAVDLLKQNGLTWMDIQMLTPVTENMGGKYISKKDFLARLSEAKASVPRALEF
jgi:leucyl/phenylalanyl-tRNA--protein transferase